MSDGELLSGGHSSGAVARVGDTVRKSWTNATPSVVAFMAAVRDAGIDVPQALGRDKHGRAVIEFVPGQLALDAERLTRDELMRVGALVRSIHDASDDFVPAPNAVWITAIPTPGNDLVCHNDLAPWNLVIGDRWVFIDWDASAPSTRLWDLAYSAQAFALSDAQRDPRDAASDLAAFVNGYGASLELRAAVAATMLERTRAMYDLLADSHQQGIEPWGSMYRDGHGDHWRAAVEYVHRHQELWMQALTVDPVVR